ncbi:uncharacterized protein [Amphiura filiformis]|uniref:uncharacterized protein n=1 Tax=Amphiura filiformis TaxID=82378 RepID=UPI003B21CCE2
MATALVANYGGSSSEDESEEEETPAPTRKEPNTSKESSGINLLTSTNADSDDEDSDSDKLTSKSVSLPKKSSLKSLVDNNKSKLPLPSFMTQDLSIFSATSTDSTSSSGTKSLAPSSVFTNPFEKAEKQKLSILEQHVKLSSAEKTEAEMGKKICWMYRKGRCRFGHKCKFAHDNDINVKQVTEEEQDTVHPVLAAMGGQHGGQHLQHGQQFEDEGFGGHNNEDEDQSTMQRKRKKPGLAQGLVPPKKSMMAFQRQAAHERPWSAKR